MTDRIADVRVTPIAFRDPPLLNVSGEGDGEGKGEGKAEGNGEGEG